MDHPDRKRINLNIIIKFIILVFDDYRSFKYNSSLDSPDDTTRRGYLDNNLSFESCTIGDTQTEKEGSRSFFVEHYRKHSKQLVDAFQEWKTQLMNIRKAYSLQTE